ncbi:MAG: hypothetical protein CVV27_07355 [Candidatus Melainabacteria bacterium HGW-Melainabacteria-1]|nr:MAG: hypothetical protein CVV27_07355 [Candidatus Melainabacteria bacterium HGW-Melainabacteria-1]
MSKRFTVPTSFVKSALALHVSLLSLTACNGDQPLPLFTGFGSEKTATAQGSIEAQAGGQGQIQANTGGQASSGNTAIPGGPSAQDNSNGNNNGGSGPKFEREVPVYHVVGHGLSNGQAKQLAAAFKLPELKLDEDGGVTYLDAARFQHIPVKPQAESDFKLQQLTHVPTHIAQTPPPNIQEDLKETPTPIETPKPGPSGDPYDFGHEDQEKVQPEYLDLAALKAIKVMPQQVALDQILIGLRQAALLPAGKPVVGHSEFELRGSDGGESLKIQLDTQVGFEQTLGQLKLIGPGAKVKVVLDGEGHVTQLKYATRQLRGGEPVAIMAPAAAEAQALLMLDQTKSTGKWELSSELVYYAPPLSQRVQTIFPHYLIQAKIQIEGEEVHSRALLVPAVQKAPQIQLDLSQDGGKMRGQAKVSGGTAPYRYSWSSASGQLETAFSDRASVDYFLSSRDPRQGAQFNQAETLYLTVTDANGLKTSAKVSQPIDPSQIKPFESSGFRTLAPGRYDAGTEWVGLSQGLGGSRDNAQGFVNGFRSRGTPVEFNYGDFAAWEEDFKKIPLGGTDNQYTDNVDMVFYTGHANGDGWTFPGSRDDGFLHYNDASYGERELEWMMVAACGPMQISSGGMHLFDRWGRVFKGLHLLTGYANVSFDNTIEGERLSRYLLAERRSVRQAWAQMATDVQPASVTYSYMGVIGPGGLSNWNDHFWGKGPVGPDIRDVRGYWSVHAPS